MSISTEISRLQLCKTNIRNALIDKKITTAETHNFSDFAEDILAIKGGIGSEEAIIAVTALAGATVTASPTLEFTEHTVSDDESLFVAAAENGTYTITATKDDSSNSGSITVSSPIIYTLGLSKWYWFKQNSGFSVDKTSSGGTYNTQVDSNSFYRIRGGVNDVAGCITTSPMDLSKYKTMYIDVYKEGWPIGSNNNSGEFRFGVASSRSSGRPGTTIGYKTVNINASSSGMALNSRATFSYSLPTGDVSNAYPYFASHCDYSNGTPSMRVYNLWFM